MSYYAVRVGRAPGIYSDWSECKQQIEGFSGAQYKKFNSREGAVAFVNARLAPTIEAPLPSVSSRIASPKSSPKKKQIIFIDSDDEKPTISATTPAAPDLSKSVLDLIEEKRQQAKQRRKEKRNEAETISNLTTAASAPSASSVTSSSFTSQAPILLKRRNSSPERSLRPQKRANTTASSTADKIVVYTDGACSANGQSGAVAGVGVYFGDSDPRNLSEPLEGDRQTNQRAELTAAIRGLEAVSHHHGFSSHVELHTDSIYVVKGTSVVCCFYLLEAINPKSLVGITEWIHKWKRLQWNNSAKSPVANKDLWLRLDLLNTSFRKVDWVHILGHTGIKGNEEADKLATSAAAIAKKQ